MIVKFYSSHAAERRELLEERKAARHKIQRCNLYGLLKATREEIHSRNEDDRNELKTKPVLPTKRRNVEKTTRPCEAIGML